MFTSRAEYRLLLRQDNADSRLSKIGHEIGLLPDRHYKKFLAKQSAIDQELNRLYATFEGSDSLAKILSRPEVTYQTMPKANTQLSPDIRQQVEIEVKYAGYIKRQEVEAFRFKELESKNIPDSFDYASVPSLRLEARQKLSKIRPQTIGQAGRISGVSPADISIILVWLKRQAGTTASLQPPSDEGCRCEGADAVQND
jgi:tRNA uridine 5-carboxymethylaminomethyl modification enzyme